MQSDSPTVTTTSQRSLIKSLPSQMVVFTVVLRLVLFALVWLSLKSLPPEWVASGSQVLQSWSMWDGGHYVAIAENGYLVNTHSQDRSAFFPLYPMLMRIGAWLPGVSVQLAGVAISFASLAVTIWFLTDYVEKKLGSVIARESAIILLVTPYAVFLTAVYTESLFMMLAILSLWFADRKSWWVAAGFVGLATATRITGLALVPAILWLAYQNRETLGKLFGIVAVSISGILAYMVYCWAEMGSPIAFLTAQEDWGGWQHRFGDFLEVFFTRPTEIITGDHVYPIALINLGILIIAVGTIPFIWKRLDRGMAIYSTLVVAQGAASLISLGRMVIPAFGVHIIIALWFIGDGWRSSLRTGVIIVSSMVVMVLAVLFAQGKWVI